ncbi:MAG: DNA-3-methyladenine glycosylase [Candidatus Korobacteraceae bacterium]
MRRALVHLKQSDPVLARIITQVGAFRMSYREPSFEAMTRSIVFQQLAGKAAATIFDRFFCACMNGNGKGSEPATCLTPESVLALSEEQMRACGLSRQKLAYIRDLAEKTRSGAINFEQLPGMSDDEVIAHLTEVKGIGVWSAQMFLMFGLRRPDVMPVTDYGIRVAIRTHYRKRKLPLPAPMLKISEPWRPYRSIACWYLWQSLDVTTA